MQPSQGRHRGRGLVAGSRARSIGRLRGAGECARRPGARAGSPEEDRLEAIGDSNDFSGAFRDRPGAGVPSAETATADAPFRFKVAWATGRFGARSGVNAKALVNGSSVVGAACYLDIKTLYVKIYPRAWRSESSPEHTAESRVYRSLTRGENDVGQKSRF